MASVEPAPAPRRGAVCTEDGERGAMHVAAIPAVLGLVALAILLIVMLGSATSDKRESTTAADAAALAAVQRWDRHLHGFFDDRRSEDDHTDWWSLAGQWSLRSGWAYDMRSAADEYARRNGAQVINFDVDPVHRTVSVRVRNDETVPKTSERIEAEATARLDLTGGLCLDGGYLGYRLGDCETTPEPEPTPSPPPTPTPEPNPTDPAGPPVTPSPEPTPTLPPFEAPSLLPYRSEAILIG